MKMIKVRYNGTYKKGDEFWVKDTNPYFDWYKKSKAWIVVEEKVL